MFVYGTCEEYLDNPDERGWKRVLSSHPGFAVYTSFKEVREHAVRDCTHSPSRLRISIVKYRLGEHGWVDSWSIENCNPRLHPPEIIKSGVCGNDQVKQDLRSKNYRKLIFGW